MAPWRWATAESRCAGVQRAAHVDPVPWRAEVLHGGGSGGCALESQSAVVLRLGVASRWCLRGGSVARRGGRSAAHAAGGLSGRGSSGSLEVGSAHRWQRCSGVRPRGECRSASGAVAAERDWRLLRVMKLAVRG
jgi:hypothetical protein